MSKVYIVSTQNKADGQILSSVVVSTKDALLPTVKSIMGSDLLGDNTTYDILVSVVESVATVDLVLKPYPVQSASKPRTRNRRRPTKSGIDPDLMKAIDGSYERIFGQKWSP